jgi:uncharacterized protein YndB with AHSA1/START domain
MPAPVETSVTISAPARTIWNLVSDVTNMGRWSPETERAEWVDGATGPDVGARFKGYNRRGKGKWSTTCEVTAAEPGKLFAFAVGGAAKFSTKWAYRFEPEGADTRVTESYELRKPIGFFSALVTRVTTGVKDRDADLVDGMNQTLERLKKAAETDSD